MKLIRTLLDRLSDSFFVSVSEKLELATEPSNVPPLRLVSDKSVLSSTVDTTTRRPTGHSISQVDALDDAVRRSQAWLVSKQHASEGYWVAELEADTTLTAEYLLLRRFLDRVDPERERKAVRYLRAMQLPDGGWPIFYGGPSEISASVKAYFPSCFGLVTVFWRWAASCARTCLQRSLWHCSSNMIGRVFRACRQKSCSCRSGSISVSMRFPIGLAPC
jgi:hypothetical protein